MSKLTWDNFVDAYPRSHLVVAWLHGRQRIGTTRQALFALLERVATVLEPHGDWTITDANASEIYIAYENEADAALLCTLVRAKPLGPSIQWLSQAAFRLQRETKESLAQTLRARNLSSSAA